MSLEIKKLTNANVYIEGDSLLGRAKEIELPSIVQKMADHEALGMVGTIETASGIEKMEGKIMWNSFYQDVITKIADPTKAFKIMVRGNLETHDSSGMTAQVPAVTYLTIRFKKLPMGNFKQHENVELESDFACYYAKQEINGVEMFEYDPMSNIYTVNGNDILSTYRENIGG